MTSILSHTDDAHQRRTWPIYVLCCHRSGSTLLRYLLDAHERLACPPETKFIAALQPFLEYPQAREGLESLGVPQDVVLQELRLFVERIMTRYTVRQHKSRWVDKTPNYYRYTHLLEQLFQGRALYIILTRHPLDCISSLEVLPLSPAARDPELARVATTFGYGRYAWAQYWHEVYTKLWLFAATRPERTIIVKYEDLVSAPERILQQICAFIGEPYDPTLVARAFSTEHTRGFGDFKIRQTGSVHTDSVGQWHSWPREERETLWAGVHFLATKFGYTIADVATRPAESAHTA